MLYAEGDDLVQEGTASVSANTTAKFENLNGTIELIRKAPYPASASALVELVAQPFTHTGNYTNYENIVTETGGLPLVMG